MANGRIRAEGGKTTGARSRGVRGRWMKRADAKKYADKERRRQSRLLLLLVDLT